MRASPCHVSVGKENEVGGGLLIPPPSEYANNEFSLQTILACISSFNFTRYAPDIRPSIGRGRRDRRCGSHLRTSAVERVLQNVLSCGLLAQDASSRMSASVTSIAGEINSLHPSTSLLMFSGETDNELNSVSSLLVAGLGREL